MECPTTCRTHGGLMTVLSLPVDPHVSTRGSLPPPLRGLDFSDPDLPLFPAGEDDRLDAIVISDLHLGSDNCEAKAAAAFLQEVLDGRPTTRRLIINGDVFDSIDFRRLK